MNKDLCAVAVGYNFALVPRNELVGIYFKDAGAVRVDGKNYVLSKGFTYEESRKIDVLLDKYEEYSIADYKIEPVIMSGEVEMTIPGFDKVRDSFIFGAYAFVCDGNVIPVDFSGTAWDIQQEGEKVTVSFTTGRTPLATDCFLDSCYEADYSSLGLRINDITAEFLAKANAISEFMVSLELDGQECGPVDIARLGQFSIKALSFQNDSKVFSVSPEVLEAYNENLREEAQHSVSISLLEQADALLEDICKKTNGSELFYLAGILNTMDQEEVPLEREEMFRMAQRIVDISDLGNIPILTAERVDAVCWLLNNGMSVNRSPEFPKASPEQMKEILLTCDIDVFGDIVETVAVDNQYVYGPENPHSQYAQDLRDASVAAIEAVVERKASLEDQVKSASSRAGTITDSSGIDKNR